MLGPIDRYKKYNHFPWKFLVHIMLIAITSFQVITIVNIQTDFAYNSQELYLRKFMTPPWAPDDTKAVGETITLYDIVSVRDLVTTVNQNYYDMFTDNVFEMITPSFTDAAGDPLPIEMVIRTIDVNKPTNVTDLLDPQL